MMVRLERAMLATMPTKLLGAASTTASANGCSTPWTSSTSFEHDIQQHLCASLPVLRKSTARERHKASEGAPTVNVVEDAVASPGQKTSKNNQTHTISIHFISFLFPSLASYLSYLSYLNRQKPSREFRKKHNAILCCVTHDITHARTHMYSYYTYMYTSMIYVLYIRYVSTIFHIFVHQLQMSVFRSPPQMHHHTPYTSNYIHIHQSPT